MKNETHLITPQTSVPCICFHVGQSSHWHLYLATIHKAADFHEMMHAVMLSYQSRKYNQQHEHHEHEYKQLSSLDSLLDWYWFVGTLQKPSMKEIN